MEIDYTKILERLYTEKAHFEPVIATDWAEGDMKKILNVRLRFLAESKYITIAEEGKDRYRVNLLLAGIEWNERRISDSIQERINIKVADYSRHQRNTAICIGFFTLVTTFTSVATLWKACEEPDTLKIQPMRMSQTQLDSSLRFQRGIDSVLQSMGKRDSLRFAKGVGIGTTEPQRPTSGQ
jgi:hypothetical protein